MEMPKIELECPADRACAPWSESKTPCPRSIHRLQRQVRHVRVHRNAPRSGHEDLKEAGPGEASALPLKNPNIIGKVRRRHVNDPKMRSEVGFGRIASQIHQLTKLPPGVNRVAKFD